MPPLRVVTLWVKNLDVPALPLGRLTPRRTGPLGMSLSLSMCVIKREIPHLPNSIPQIRLQRYEAVLILQIDHSKNEINH